MGEGKDGVENLLAPMREGREAKAKELGALQRARNMKNNEELPIQK
ncbi:hypothetical protein AGMMS49940_10270 [Spirochaetia bacterium]|nr:hypothetical protein AGMMS49940_10270 [Spirochaetia bacterium]